MSDEAAFLSALKANPADDTTRLVFADWLDEHGEPAKAEYLRLVSTLAQRGGGPETSECHRALEVARSLDPTWRAAAGARFALTLTGYTDKVRAIKVSRDLTSWGLGKTKDFVERAPSRFPLRLTVEGVCGVYRHFSGGDIRIDSQCRDTDPAVVVVFDVAVDLVPTVWDAATIPVPPERVRAFLGFLVTTGHLTRARAAGTGQAVAQSLATNLQLHQLEERLSEWRALLPPADAAQNWQIAFRVSFHPL